MHFVSKDRKLHHITLALQEIDGSHTGEAMAAEIVALYEDFGILHQIGYMIADNHYVNDTMGTWLDYELELRGIPWAGSKYRIRCSGHIVNLSVKAFLYGCSSEEDFKDVASKDSATWRKLGTIGKLHNIVIYILKGVERRQHWRQEYSGGKLLRRDNTSR